VAKLIGVNESTVRENTAGFPAPGKKKDKKTTVRQWQVREIPHRDSAAQRQQKPSRAFVSPVQT